MDEINNLFSTATKQEEIKNFADKYVESIERDFGVIKENVDETSQDRETEKQVLLTKLKELQKQLDKYKNVKNHRLSNINTNIHAKRKKIRSEIEQLKIKLDSIGLEEEGSKLKMKNKD